MTTKSLRVGNLTPYDENFDDYDVMGEEGRRKELLDTMTFEEIEKVVEWYRRSINNGIEDEEESDSFYFKQLSRMSDELGIHHIHQFIQQCFERYPPTD